MAELVQEFHDVRDVPAGHRCTTSGPLACTHEAWAHGSLLERVGAIVMPGTGAARDPESKKSKGQRGSPAPWSAGPAHLLDEVHRGAVGFDRQLRAALDLGPLHVQRGVGSRRRIGPTCREPVTLRAGAEVATCVHRSCQPIRKAITTLAADTPPDIAGPAALRGLPLLIELLHEREPTNPLVAGALINPAHPERGRRWGPVEQAVRGWHAAAKALTGHEDKPIVIRQRVNPFAHEFWPGPTCEDAWLCGHLSCRLIFLAPRPRWEQAACPHCSSHGFTWDPLWGVLRCDHPQCRDEDGRRPEWSMEAFMAPIHELVDSARKAGIRE